MISNWLVSQDFFMVHYHGLYLQGRKTMNCKKAILVNSLSSTEVFLAPSETGRCLPPLNLFVSWWGWELEGYEMKWPHMDILSWLEMTLKWGGVGVPTVHIPKLFMSGVCVDFDWIFLPKIWTCTITTSCAGRQLPDHWATLSLTNKY